MSVPSPLRSESKLIAQMKTEEMITHTLHITANENVFDPKYHVLADKINDLAISIGKDIWEANGIRVNGNPEHWRIRHGLQDRACRHFNDLLYLIGLAKKTYHLRSRKFYAWINKVTEARDYTRKWRDSDVSKYGHLGSGRRG